MKHQSKLDELYTERAKILAQLNKQHFTIHTHDNWRDAIPESYSDMKQLQAQITTINA